jgi:hypothetical protein
MEKRRFARFRVNVDAIFAYRDEQGREFQYKAKTKDISCQGVFLLTGSNFKVGTKLDVEIFLRNTVINDGKKKSVITGTGEVVRTTNAGLGIDFTYSLLKPVEKTH